MGNISDLANKLAQSNPRLRTEFGNLLSLFSRRVVDLDEEVQFDPDDLPGTAGRLDAASASALQYGPSPRWHKHSITLEQLQALGAVTSGAITLFALPAAGVIHAVKVKHSAALAGGSLSAATVSVGISGTATKYSSAYNVFAAASATAMQVTGTIGVESQAATKDIIATVTLTAANANALTAGAVDVWVLVSVAE